jgi:hypothetical protein
LPAILHNLHDASVHLAHQHELESPGYRFARPIPPAFVFQGTAAALPNDCFQGILEVLGSEWREHPVHRLVPEFTIHNNAPGVDAQAYALYEPWQSATESDLEPLQIEGQPREHDEDAGNR